MKIIDIIKNDSIIANLVGTNKEEVLNEVTDFLLNKEIIKDKQVLLHTLI